MFRFIILNRITFENGFSNQKIQNLEMRNQILENFEISPNGLVSQLSEVKKQRIHDALKDLRFENYKRRTTHN